MFRWPLSASSETEVYSGFWRVEAQAYTMQRALTFDFPEDAAARRIADAYMFGPSLLVTPIVSAGDSGKATTREIYFPHGSWINFHSGEKYGGTQNVSFTLQQAPFFCRKGSLLVLGPSIQSTADTNPDLEVRIYPGADATFALFEDDGSSTKYREGSYSTIDFCVARQHLGCSTIPHSHSCIFHRWFTQLRRNLQETFPSSSVVESLGHSRRSCFEGFGVIGYPRTTKLLEARASCSPVAYNFNCSTNLVCHTFFSSASSFTGCRAKLLKNFVV